MLPTKRQTRRVNRFLQHFQVPREREFFATACIALLLAVFLWPLAVQAQTSQRVPADEIRVIDLKPNTQGQDLARARWAYRKGHIIRIIGGTGSDLRDMLGIAAVAPTAQTSSSNSPSQKSPGPHVSRIVAVRMTDQGSLHQFSQFSHSSIADTSAEAFQEWADEEIQAAKVGGVGDTPTPPQTAWTELQQETITDKDSDGNEFTMGVSLFRANDINSGKDWYMVLSDPITKPHFFGGHCISYLDTCGWWTHRRIITMEASPVGLASLAEHGPSNNITTSTGGFSIGGTISFSPGVSGSYSQSWPQPSVTTTDKTDLINQVPLWWEDFEGQPAFGSPPNTSILAFLSHQGSIFSVPEGTTAFSISVGATILWNYDYCPSGLHDFNVCYDDDYYTVPLNVAPPIFAVDRNAINIPAGSSGVIQLTAEIPNSKFGLPWTLTNLPTWLTASQVSGTSNTKITLTVNPPVTNGETASLNFNTQQLAAAPSVEENPLIVTVKVGEPTVTSGVLALGGIDASQGGAALSSGEIVDPVVSPAVLMSTPRTLHTATVLEDGTLLIVGGSTQSEGGAGLATAEIYDPVAGLSTPTGSMNTPRLNHTATLLPDGKVLITGGLAAAGEPALATAEIYDPVDKSFQLTGTMNSPRALHTATLLPNGDVLIAGGLIGGSTSACLASAEIYHDGTFTPTNGPMTTAHCSHTSTLLNTGEVLIGSGFVDEEAQAATPVLDIYLPATKTFSSSPGHLFNARGNHTATLLISGEAGDVLFTGGNPNSFLVTTDLSTAEVYNRERNTVILLGGSSVNCPGHAGCMVAGRSRHTATLMPDGKVLLVGGLTGDGNQSLASTEIFDPDSLTGRAAYYFAPGPNVTARSSHTATLLSFGATINLAANPDSSSLGQAVTFTANVNGGQGTPTGTITFNDGGTPISQPIQASSGQVKFTTTALTVGNHSITAVYSGSFAYRGVTSSPLFFAVSPNQTQTSLTSSSPENTSAPGQSVTFTAKVTPTSGKGTPTGIVTFKDSNVAIGNPAPLASGQAQITIDNLSPGSHTISAVYDGDATFSGSASPALVQSVLYATTVKLSSDLNPAIFGQAVTLTANVAATGSSTPPTGSVLFTDNNNGTQLGPAVALVNGIAKLTTTSLSMGTHALKAQYTADGNFVNGTSNALSQFISGGTSTQLSASPNPSVVGQNVTFTATVTVIGGITGKPTGSVSFTVDNSAPTVVNLTNGNCSFSTNSLTAGTHSIAAKYSGDSNFSGSSSSPFSQIVKDKSATIVNVAPSPAVLNQDVTLTATVSGSSGTPTGSVSFKDGTASIGTVPLDSGKAPFITSSLAVGTHSITAVYSGDGVYAASTSPAFNEVISLPGTTTKLTSDPNPSAAGQDVTLSVTVTANSGGGTPTGTVTFSDGRSQLGTIPLNAGKAPFIIGTLAAGVHSITAAYSGDGNFAKSTSSVLTQTVNPVQAKTAFSSLTQSQTVNLGTASVSLAGVISALGPAYPPANENVTVSIGNVTKSVNIGAKGAFAFANFPISSLAAGTYTIQYDYAGDANFTSASDGTTTLTINNQKFPTIATLLSNPNPSNSGQQVVFTLTVTSQGGGTPSGNVTLAEHVGQTVNILGQGNLDGSGKVPFPISSLAGGAHLIDATYGGDNTHLPATSNSVNQQVN
jgi:Bacterial Ig-like domain (group 3)/Galactose oxidase, central domain